jgi:putative ABC transport system ATP-binding protein
MMTAVAIRDLQFTWPNTRQPTLVIERFELARGEKVFLKGASGSGKSTLMQLIAGVLTPSQGQLSVLGNPLSAMRSSQRDQFRADHLGFVFQLFNLLPFLSIEDNVLLPCRFSKARAARALALGQSLRGGAQNLLSALGLPQAQWRKSVAQLSVGQQQRVALARALLGAPELVICDEPTSAIDATLRDSFMRLLIAQIESTGASLLFVSHDPSLERYFDRSVALSAINQVASETQNL